MKSFANLSLEQRGQRIALMAMVIAYALGTGIPWLLGREVEWSFTAIVCVPGGMIFDLYYMCVEGIGNNIIEMHKNQRRDGRDDSQT